MTSFPILDLVLGIIFLYFLLSIITSSVVELILSFFRLRSLELEKWLYTVLDKPALNADGRFYDQNRKLYMRVSTDSKDRLFAGVDEPGTIYRADLKGNLFLRASDGSETATGLNLISLGQGIMDHCVTSALSKKGKAASYIDAKNFTSAFLEKITLSEGDPGSIPQTIDDFEAKIQDSPVLSRELKRTLLTYIVEAKDAAKKTGNVLHQFRSRVERWYDATTDRISGSLKRKWVLPFTFLIATGSTIGLNADTVALAKYLYSNKDARNGLAAQAATAAQDSANIAHYGRNRIIAETTADTGGAAISKVDSNAVNVMVNVEAYKATGMPFGYEGEVDPLNGQPLSWGAIIKKHIIGWLATIFAICLGTPFWFDLLSRIANLRGTGPKPGSVTSTEAREENKKEDA